MTIKDFLYNQKREIKDIIKKVISRDFKGNKGTAIKNNLFQTLQMVISKGGSLFLVIILARLLMPDLFGLYNLALSTIILFSALSNMGTRDVLIRFVSKALGKNDFSKAKSYAVYIGKIQFFLALISMSFLVISAKFISESYYHKPIFLALIAGALYILFLRIMTYTQTILQSINCFKEDTYREIFLQVFRLIIIPLTVLFVLKWGISDEKIIFSIILSSAFALLLCATVTAKLVNKKAPFLKTKYKKLTKEDKKHTHKFIFANSATALAGMFFEHVDMLILGPFVVASFIGYYKAGAIIVGALIPILNFSLPLLPVFSRLNSDKINKAMKKTTQLTFSLSLVATLFLLLFAPFIIKIIYGDSYSSSITILRIFSLLLISSSLSALYKTYFISLGKPKIVTKLLFISTIINVALNYLLIFLLLPYGQMAAVFGVVIATVISKYLLLFGLMFERKKLSKA